MVTTHHPDQIVAAHHQGRTVVDHHLTEVGEEVQEIRHGLRSTMIGSGYHQVYARSVALGITCGAHGGMHVLSTNGPQGGGMLQEDTGSRTPYGGKMTTHRRRCD